MPVLFYMRFFLHSIPEDVQETLIGVISSCARPGDMLAAEFRTTEDASAKKVFGRHYRRFQDGPAFGGALRERHGFDPVFESRARASRPMGTRILCSIAWSLAGGADADDARTRPF